MSSRWRERLPRALGFRLGALVRGRLLGERARARRLTYLLLAARCASATARSSGPRCVRTRPPTSAAAEALARRIQRDAGRRPLRAAARPRARRRGDACPEHARATGGASTWRSSRRRRCRRAGWARCRGATAARLEVRRSAARRHAVPGRQEHRAPRGAAARASAACSCSSPSRRAHRRRRAARLTCSALQPVRDLGRDRARHPARPGALQRARAGPRRPATRSTSWARCSTRCSTASRRWSPACAARSTTSPTTCARR